MPQTARPQRGLPGFITRERLGVRPNDTFERDRECVEPECITILCRYNPGPRCYRHEAQVEGREFLDRVRRGHAMIEQERRAGSG